MLCVEHIHTALRVKTFSLLFFTHKHNILPHKHNQAFKKIHQTTPLKTKDP